MSKFPTQRDAAMKTELTETFIAMCQPMPGRRLTYHDSRVPNLLLIVHPSGHMSWFLAGRFPLRPNISVRLKLGEYAADPLHVTGLTLPQAREKAAKWRTLMTRGIDPRDEDPKRTFESVRQEYLAQQRDAGRKKATEVGRLLEREFPTFANRPIRSITARDIEAALRVTRDRAPGQAHPAWAALSGVLKVALDRELIQTSPLKGIDKKALLGERPSRERALIVDEAHRVWWVAEAEGYPYGPVIQLLMLLGLRLNEILQLSWSEVDLDSAEPMLRLPPERVKNKAGHVLPLPPFAAEILRGLPRHKGPYVFTSTNGKRGLGGIGRAKIRFDAACGFTDWVFHDLRRTWSTMAGALPGRDVAKSFVQSHARSPTQKIYDIRACDPKEALEILTTFEQWFIAEVIGPGPWRLRTPSLQRPERGGVQPRPSPHPSV